MKTDNESYFNELVTGLDLDSSQLEKLRENMGSLLIRKKYTYETMDGVPEGFCDYMRSLKVKGMSEGTIALYTLRLKDFFSHIPVKIDDLTPNDVREYLADIKERRKLSDRTLDQVRMIVATFLKWMADERLIQCNPSANVNKIHYAVKRREPLTSWELEKIRYACKTPREKALIEFLYSTGCRVSEILDIRKSDIDMQRGFVEVFGKGAKWRRVFLTPKCLFYLENYFSSRKDSQPYAFVTDRAPKQMTKTGAEKVIRVLGERSGIRRTLHPHLFRHTVATDCLKKGMAVENVKQMLGHSNLNTTMIYAHVDTNRVQSELMRCIG